MAPILRDLRNKASVAVVHLIQLNDTDITEDLIDVQVIQSISEIADFFYNNTQISLTK